MEEDIVNYSKEEEEAFQRSIFMTRDELVETWKGSKAFSKDCLLEKPLNLTQGKAKSKSKGLSKSEILVIMEEKTCSTLVPIFKILDSAESQLRLELGLGQGSTWT